MKRLRNLTLVMLLVLVGGFPTIGQTAGGQQSTENERSLLTIKMVNTLSEYLNQRFYENSKTDDDELIGRNWMKSKNYLMFNEDEYMSLTHQPLDENSEEVLDSWMIDMEAWKIEAASVMEIRENTILEDWMVDTDFWKLDVPILHDSVEDWMINPDFWDVKLNKD